MQLINVVVSSVNFSLLHTFFPRGICSEQHSSSYTLVQFHFLKKTFIHQNWLLVLQSYPSFLSYLCVLGISFISQLRDLIKSPSRVYHIAHILADPSKQAKSFVEHYLVKQLQLRKELAFIQFTNSILQYSVC